ncbi:MAG: PD40 domain-containing protein, partial [Deltaproteobacteria bacterium]|nr:PD40 domain-containing protein [Deltaproteobacteria bacterium]
TLDVVTPTPGQAERKVGWSTFSPDGNLLLVSEKGILRLLETATGEPVGPNDGIVPLPPGNLANMPDWSGLGDKVAFAMTSKDKVGNKDIEAASIAVIDYDNGAWGEVAVLVASEGGVDNNFFPAWSPDSAWIAYVNAQQKSKDAVTASVRLVSADGSASRELTRLNERVKVTRCRAGRPARSPEPSGWRSRACARTRRYVHRMTKRIRFGLRRSTRPRAET